MNRFLFIILFAVCSPLTSAVAQDIAKIDSILCNVIHVKDQDLRFRLFEEGLSDEDTIEIAMEIDESDRQNQEYVADILDTYGWPEGLSSEADQTIGTAILP